jgi:2-C-methyl-D-erythritol 4-phosphate cytidylyltransferase
LLRATAAGRPLFAWSLLTLEGAGQIEAAVLLVEPERVQEARHAVIGAGAHAVEVVGIGQHGHSKAQGWLDALDALPRTLRHVVLHEASRPLLRAELVTQALAAALVGGAASACVPVKETVKCVQEGWVAATLDRSRLALLQTPQVFDRAVLEAALRTAPAAKGPRDILAAVRRAGLPIATFSGDAENSAVASLEDLAVAERLLRIRLSR